MIFPEIDGWPWGWGAARIEPPEDGWVCPDCGWKAKRNSNGTTARGRHLYLFGGERCTKCAKRWCEANWTPKKKLWRKPA